jgi:phosphoribosylanthranilate isomerase
MVTRVKICGLTRIEDVELAASLGADALGFVLEPTSPRCISVQTAEALSAYAGPYCTTVAVYGRSQEQEPSLQAVQAVQFRALTQKTAIQAIRLREETTLADIVEASKHADAVLLDAYSSDAFGGTGKSLDWHRAAEIISSLTKPVILAGGLTPDNVAEAIERVRPYAVDVSSGVESSPGVKDPAMVRAFIEAARAAK